MASSFLRFRKFLKLEIDTIEIHLDVFHFLERIVEAIVILGSNDYLWEIGSGSNWLSYHVATSLALQIFFLQKLDESPVPSFLVYDQPSQVYFPKRLSDVEDSEEDLDPKLRDTDVEALQKVYRAFGTAVNSTQGRLQVIVLDHAAENVWSGIEGIHKVDDWRQGRKLIPAEWL